MDAKMRDNIVTGLMILCLILGLWGQFDTSWWSSDEDEVDRGAGLRTTWIEYENKDECEDFAEILEDVDVDSAECSDNVLSYSINEYSEDYACEADKKSENCKNSSDAASAGFTGGLILLFASITALICIILLIIEIAGVEINAVLDKTGMIMMWTTGTLTILAVFLWYTMLPDSWTDDLKIGSNTWMTVVGGIFALAAGGMDTFMADE